MIAQAIANLQKFRPVSPIEDVISGYIEAVLTKAFNGKFVVNNPSEFGIFLFNAFYDWRFAKPPSVEAKLKSEYLRRREWDLLPNLTEINHLDRRTAMFIDIERLIKNIVPESHTVIAKLRELFFAQDYILKQSLVVFFNQVFVKRIYHIMKDRPVSLKLCGGFAEFDIEIIKEDDLVVISIISTRKNKIHLMIPLSLQLSDVETRSNIFKAYEIAWILDIVIENFAQIESSFAVVNK